MPLENRKVIGFLSNTSPDPLEKTAFNVRPHLNDVSLRWADDVPLLVVFGSSFPASRSNILVFSFEPSSAKKYRPTLRSSQ